MPASLPTRALPQQATKRWALLAGLGWLAAAGALVQVAVAALWGDDLHPVSNGMLAVQYLAFMARVFVVHAGIAMLAVLIFACATRRVRLGIAAGFPMLIGCAPLTHGLFRDPTPPQPGADTLCVLSVNIMYGQADLAAIQAHIERERPDVIAVQEWTSGARTRWIPALQGEYPHVAEVARDDAFGQAMFSRRPFVESPMIYPPAPGLREPQITITVNVDGRPMRVTNVHLPPPVSLVYFAEQRAMARGLSTWARSDNGPRPHVLIGDFNATHNTPIVRAFVGTGWREAHSEAGRGRGSTWPSTGALAYMPGIRLDHAAVAPELDVAEARVAEPVGSDHLPILVRVRWAR